MIWWGARPGGSVEEQMPVIGIISTAMISQRNSTAVSLRSTFKRSPTAVKDLSPSSRNPDEVMIQQADGRR
jgi:hypothetical protein